jgi:hypothetical protein
MLGMQLRDRFSGVLLLDTVVLLLPSGADGWHATSAVPLWSATAVLQTQLCMAGQLSVP